MLPELTQHHIGCLVESIAEFRILNSGIWSDDRYSPVYDVSSQDVKVCFLKMTEDTRLELVEPGTGNLALLKLRSKGLTYYHIAFETKSFDESVKKLVELNCKFLTEFKSEAFDGKRCGFLYHPDIRLIELIEHVS